VQDRCAVADGVRALASRLADDRQLAP
jgi:hypothetical protein